MEPQRRPSFPHETLTNRSRLQEIVDLDLFAPEVRDLLDDLTAEAAARLGVENSNVSLVLDQAQSFASMHGAVDPWLSDTRGTPIEWAFCRYVVEEGGPFVVEDAASNARMQESPLVTEGGVRCYLGMPLRTSRGFVVGSFCVLGKEPRAFSEADRALVGELAEEAMRRIERRAGRTRKKEASAPGTGL